LQRSADRDLARQLLAKTEPHATSGPAQREHQQAVGEPVTAKELEVLRLLATPMSRREIGIVNRRPDALRRSADSSR
jgi:DNA-binding NarL/FixJ family response regulator